MMKLLKELDLMEYVLLFLLAFVLDIDLLYNILLVLLGVQTQIGVTESSLSDNSEYFVF